MNGLPVLLAELQCRPAWRCVLARPGRVALHREGTDGRLAPAVPLMPDGCNVRRYARLSELAATVPAATAKQGGHGKPKRPPRAAVFCHF